MTAEQATRDPLDPDDLAEFLENAKDAIERAAGLPMTFDPRRVVEHWAPRLLAGYDTLFKAHKPIQIYASADDCGHERPPEPDWNASPDKDATDAWEAYEDEHTYGSTLNGDDSVRICMLTPEHLACRACSELVYGKRGDDDVYIDASECVALPLIAAALTGEETPAS